MSNFLEINHLSKRYADFRLNNLYRQYADHFRLPLKKQVKMLSRGMKMKLMPAVAMSHKAKLLILDEPTSELDETGPSGNRQSVDVDFSQERRRFS